MKLTSIKLKRILEDRLKNEAYRTSFNRDKDQFRIEWKESKKGITISLPQVIGKYEERGERAIDELVDHVTEALSIMNREYKLTGMESNIYPVIRATSFPTETKAGDPLVVREQTAETRILYAIDLGKHYRLRQESLREQGGWTTDRLHENPLLDFRSHPTPDKKGEVTGNDFDVIAREGGYDASRILDIAFLHEVAAKRDGQLAI